jgi:hypothetical protein
MEPWTVNGTFSCRIPASDAVLPCLHLALNAQSLLLEQQSHCHNAFKPYSHILRVGTRNLTGLGQCVECRRLDVNITYTRGESVAIVGRKVTANKAKVVKCIIRSVGKIQAGSTGRDPAAILQSEVAVPVLVNGYW